MPAAKKRSYARYTQAAVTLVGQLIQAERKQRRMPLQELAERVGASRGTLQRLEGGDPKVEIGLAFEACTILGIPLFQEDLVGVKDRVEVMRQRLALLPKYARPLQTEADDDF
ncbi:helix-turn-helix transcriptional regulator [Novosphingobium sp. PS1R-30]|uniref:Helix-turn-helix transcriptional regulator n=1 Tax=Novosphingobium anseongense TaxID=3133436 RepID=A0ABU8RUC4_9SPHN